jgi:hypothetical protein
MFLIGVKVIIAASAVSGTTTCLAAVLMVNEGQEYFFNANVFISHWKLLGCLGMTS